MRRRRRLWWGGEWWAVEGGRRKISDEGLSSVCDVQRCLPTYSHKSLKGRMKTDIDPITMRKKVKAARPKINLKNSQIISLRLQLPQSRLNISRRNILISTLVSDETPTICLGSHKRSEVSLNSEDKRPATREMTRRGIQHF